MNAAIDVIFGDYLPRFGFDLADYVHAASTCVRARGGGFVITPGMITHRAGTRDHVIVRVCVLPQMLEVIICSRKQVYLPSVSSIRQYAEHNDSRIIVIDGRLPISLPNQWNALLRILDRVWICYQQFRVIHRPAVVFPTTRVSSVNLHDSVGERVIATTLGQIINLYNDRQVTGDFMAGYEVSLFHDKIVCGVTRMELRRTCTTSTPAGNVLYMIGKELFYGRGYYLPWEVFGEFIIELSPHLS
jgi:uncharacterized protein (DUF1330 family)